MRSEERDKQAFSLASTSQSNVSSSSDRAVWQVDGDELQHLLESEAGTPFDTPRGDRPTTGKTPHLRTDEELLRN